MIELISGLNSGMNLGECEDQCWFKVQAIPVFFLIDVRCFCEHPKMSSHTYEGTRT
jgi:hypothetical protein